MQATIGVRAPAHGVLRAILVKEDDVVTVGQALAVLEDSSTQPETAKQQAQPNPSTSRGRSPPKQSQSQMLEELHLAASEVSDNAMRGKKAHIRFPPRKTELGHTISSMPKVDQEKYRARASSKGQQAHRVLLGTPRSSLAPSTFSNEPVKRTKILETEMESIMLGGAPL
jgi:pyruvate/2-oxoglutarate dehydrogenase complex dihydrolipoamide acyltransferase (E2) component